MTFLHIGIIFLLALTVSLCWLGAIGMWRMREPMQALHYLSLPASVGMVVLTVAVFLQEGFGQVAFKTALIAIVLLGINSVVSHATARAFRLRQLGTGESPDSDALRFEASHSSQGPR
jgi:monovalent cation/proton antiporter MnhG/PhaG subunit